MLNRSFAVIVFWTATIHSAAFCQPAPSLSQDANRFTDETGDAAQARFDPNDTTYYAPVKTHNDAGGLRVAGENRSGRIRGVTSINGQSIAELEALMRPGHQDDRSSKAGFLGNEERLLDVLVNDNDFVSSRGLTHADLAIPLLQICHHALAVRGPPWKTVDLQHAGVRWRVDMKEYKGFQHSPFNDKTKTNFDFTVTNLETGASLNFSGLVPIMIERYGFYEGHGTPYRVEPSAIIELLGLSLNKSEAN